MLQRAVAIVAIANFILNTIAQRTEVTCLPGSEWASNSLGQNPCLVSAYLEGACEGGQFDIPALQTGQIYTGPSLDDSTQCKCNTVVYSLVSACGLCQNNSIVTWDRWATNCSTVYVQDYPKGIPTGTAVPGWAYLDVVTSNVFNAAAAQADLDAPESTAIPSSTVSPSQTASSVRSSASKNSNAGAIAGGVVGGVVLISLVAGLALWFLRRKRNRVAPSTLVNLNGGLPAWAQMGYASPGSSPPITTPKLYDPSDPTTFPTSPAPSSAMYTTHGYAPVNPSTTHPSDYAAVGRYNGAPEL